MPGWDCRLLTERHVDQIAGVLSCYDRILVFGALPNMCFGEGMTSYLYAHKVRIFDYPRFAQPLREELRGNAEQLAAENGIEIQHIRKKNIRKEDLVKAVLAKRGSHSGLVAIFSAMEACASYQPWRTCARNAKYRPTTDNRKSLLEGCSGRRSNTGPGRSVSVSIRLFSSEVLDELT